MKSKNSIKNNWTEIKLQLKKKYPQLTEADLKYVDGYENEIFHNRIGCLPGPIGPIHARKE